MEILFSIFFLFYDPALAEWVEVEHGHNKMEWQVPAKSAGKYKYLSQKYTRKEGDDLLNVERILRYDCYSLKYYIVQAKEMKKGRGFIVLPNPSIWYTIKNNGDHHRNLIKHGVCPKANNR